MGGWRENIIYALNITAQRLQVYETASCEIDGQGVRERREWRGRGIEERVEGQRNREEMIGRKKEGLIYALIYAHTLMAYSASFIVAAKTLFMLLKAPQYPSPLGCPSCLKVSQRRSH